MALLATRAHLSLAREGQALLEQKRDALLREVYREVGDVEADRGELDTAAAAAAAALTESQVGYGWEAVEAAAAVAGRRSVRVTPSTVMGVPVPIVTQGAGGSAVGRRGRSVEAGGPAVELAAERFEAELAVAVRLATTEARLRRLAREIRRTSRRVNALRFRLVPALEAEVRALAFTLEEREREDRFRLRRVKAGRRSRPPSSLPADPATR